jgi:hypothetical protein
MYRLTIKKGTIMKKFLFVLSFCLISVNAFSKGSKFYCDNVGGTEEYTIYVDLDKNLAGFFDNDQTVVVPLKEIHFYETMPPQTAYEFLGKDTHGKKGSLIQINFNLTKLTANVRLNYGTKDQKNMDALNKCIADDDIDLELE